MQNYSLEFTLTESNAGGTLLYIANHLSYKPHTDLCLNKVNQLESTFTEIKKSRKNIIIVECLYKQPDMVVSDFNYNDHQPTNEFLNYLASNSFIPLLQWTRITSHSRTLFDNTFSNIISHEVISGNITATISVHLPQFLFALNVLSKYSWQKSNIYERDWSQFIQTHFVLGYFDKDWLDILQLDQQDVNPVG